MAGFLLPNFAALESKIRHLNHSAPTRSLNIVSLEINKDKIIPKVTYTENYPACSLGHNSYYGINLLKFHEFGLVLRFC